MRGRRVIDPEDPRTGLVFVRQARIDQQCFGGFGECLDDLVEIERGMGCGLDQFFSGACFGHLETLIQAPLGTL
ncbi:hypothetical protein D9M71_810810 [compost metagenome]